MKNDKNGTNNTKWIRIMVAEVLAILAILTIYLYNDNQKPKEDEVKYSEIVTYIDAGDVKEIKTYVNSSKIDVTLTDGTKKFTYVPSVNEFWKYVNEQRKLGNDIEISVTTSSKNNIGNLISFLSTIIAYGFMVYIIRKMYGAGDFKVKPVTSDVRFTDVAGIDEEREQLSEVVKFLKAPEQYTKMGARIPKGILLVGAPGTGKTLLAKAIAGEADVPFFQVTGSSFEEKFVGVGASRVRKIFNEAKKVAPSIIFIDEIDAVAQNRYSGKSYSEQTLNQLLAEMDGFDSNSHVIVIAATNHKEVLDPAILRPGRFDRHVYVPMPNIKARAEILEVHARNKQFSTDVNLQELARKTVGFSGANLENVLNESALLAVKLNSSCITNPIIDEAIARVIVGIKKESSILSEKEKYLTAVHEAGHAVVSAAIRPDVKNFCISIVPRGEAGGYNFFDESYKTYQQKSDMEKQIRVMYGGRCAEEVLLGDISSGASNDLERVTDFAYRMVMNFAMTGRRLVKVTSRPEFNSKIESQAVAEMEKICEEAYRETTKIVTENKEVISKLAALLMEKEYLSDIEVSAFLSNNYIAQ